MLRCIFCGMCEEACPEDAIYLEKKYELADYQPRRLHLHQGRAARPDRAESGYLPER